MKTKSLLIGMAIFSSVATSHAAAVFALEGPIVNPANGNIYYWGSIGNWTEAETFAVSVGGHLATINDAAENAWIVTTFLTPHPGANPYIGLIDTDLNDIWTWVSGEPVSYLNWAPGEPNNAWERYSNLFPSSGLWNNTIPTDNYFSIIEVVPEPSSLSLFALAVFQLCLGAPHPKSQLTIGARRLRRLTALTEWCAEIAPPPRFTMHIEAG